MKSLEEIKNLIEEEFKGKITFTLLGDNLVQVMKRDPESVSWFPHELEYIEKNLPKGFKPFHYLSIYNKEESVLTGKEELRFAIAWRKEK